MKERSLKLVKSKKRVRELGEVFTPPNIVSDMIDMVQDQDCDVIRGNWFEPCCGTGNFQVEIARRKLAAGMSPEEAANTMFSGDIMQDNVDETIDRLVEILPGTREILEKHILRGDMLNNPYLDKWWDDKGEPTGWHRVVFDISKLKKTDVILLQYDQEGITPDRVWQIFQYMQNEFPNNKIVGIPKSVSFEGKTVEQIEEMRKGFNDAIDAALAERKKEQ